MSQLHHFNDKDYDDSGFYNFSDTDFRMVNTPSVNETGDRLTQRREKTARIFRIIIVLLLFVLFAQVMYHLYFARNVKIEKIHITAGSTFSATDKQILEMAGISGGESYFGLDEAAVAARLERYPQISSASVEKKFPDTLNIAIEGRTPLAVCLIETEGRVVPAAVDSAGVVFQLGKSVTDLNLPVISGVRIAEARLGVVMPAAVKGFLSSLEILRKESPAFFNSISECRIIRKDNDDFEVLMYPQNYSIPVRVGSRIDKDLFTYILLVLDVARSQGMSDYLEELDFRTDEVVYRIRGE